MGELENKYQSELKKRIEDRFKGSIVLKNDPTFFQGIPDLTVLYKDHWATLEVKRNGSAPHRPNQKYYVEMMNEMSFSATIYPENEEEVLDALQRTFQSGRKTRSSRSK